MQKTEARIREAASKEFDALLSDLLPRIFLAALEDGGVIDTNIAVRFTFLKDKAQIEIEGAVEPRPSISAKGTEVAYAAQDDA